MPIFDQGYQHWQGKLTHFNMRWLAVAYRGVKTQYRNRWLRYLVMMSLLASLILPVFLAIWGIVEQKASFAEPLMNLLSMFDVFKNKQVLNSAKDFRVEFWTLAFYYFLHSVTMISLVLVLLVGPDLISQDLRFNAIPLYLSRPIRRIDYFLGKLSVIGFFIGLVSAVPLTLAYILGLLFSMDPSVIRQTFPLYLWSLAYCLVLILSAGAFMLAISSLTRNSRYVSVMFVIFWFLTGTVSVILQTAMPKQQWPQLVSYQGNLLRVCEGFTGRNKAWDQLKQKTSSLMAKAQVLSSLGMGENPLIKSHPAIKMTPPKLEAKKDPPKKNASKKDKPQKDKSQDPTTDGKANQGKQRNGGVTPAIHVEPEPKVIRVFGWEWSLGILAALFGISICMLSFRVRSLDRLK